MARKREGDVGLSPMSRRLTPPGVFLLRMTIFLTLIGFLAAILFDQLKQSWLTNPGLNGLIVGVLLFGILYAYRQVFRLYPEIRWVNAFRISDPGLESPYRPVLLAPMATMLRDRTGTLSLSPAAMRAFMDSISSGSMKRAIPAAILSACSCSSGCSARSGVCSTPSALSARPSIRWTTRQPTTCRCSAN